jgi:predicted nuclease with TOPRIM domain
MSQAELKAKYKSQKSKTAICELKNRQLKAGLRTILERPCSNCETERRKHEHTKKALEESIALSSVLLREVMALDAQVKEQPKSASNNPVKTWRSASVDRE